MSISLHMYVRICICHTTFDEIYFSARENARYGWNADRLWQTLGEEIIWIYGARGHTNAHTVIEKKERKEWEEGGERRGWGRERERERERGGGDRGSSVRQKAARCEPDEPRTNRATNQWCDGPSLPSLTQRVYHTETNGRKSLAVAGEGRNRDTDPLLIPHARSLVLCRVLSRAKMI